MSRQTPLVTLVVSVLAVVATSWLALGELLVYERGAVLDGEVWRVATAPLVHFSVGHLFWDLVVFGVMGWCIEGAGSRRFAALCIATALLTGLYVGFSAPEIERYGGLSGLATGAVVYFGVRGLRIAPGRRWPWFGLLGLVAAKILGESFGGPLFAAPPGEPFTVLVEAHLIGAGCGLLLALSGAMSNSGHGEKRRTWPWLPLPRVS